MRGIAFSRLQPTDEVVGSAEYKLKTADGISIRWPQGYAEHYIGKHNVMPTERFFTYIVEDAGNPGIRPPPVYSAPSPKKFGHAEGYWDNTPGT